MHLCLVLIAGLLLFTCEVHAHISNVTYTDVWLNNGHVELRFTVPADSLVELDSPQEEEGTKNHASRYGERVLRGFPITNNDKTCPATLIDTRVIDNIHSYQYTLHYECAGSSGKYEIGYRVFPVLPESHENFVDVHIGEKKLDLVLSAHQPILHLDLQARGQHDGNRASGGPLEARGLAGACRFVALGMEHILTGLDHLLFVLTLLQVALSLRELLIVITSFTAAHSITLVLGSLQTLSLNLSLVERLIALSISYVAVENIVHVYRYGEVQRRSSRLRRAFIAFVFGLIHGLGFSSALTDIGMPQDSLALSLVGFNIGIELGQLAVIAIVLPVLVLVWGRFSYQFTCICASTLAGAIGLYWFYSRF